MSGHLLPWTLDNELPLPLFRRIFLIVRYMLRHWYDIADVQVALYFMACVVLIFIILTVLAHRFSTRVLHRAVLRIVVIP